MLKPSQIGLFVGLGIGFWFTGMMFIRLSGSLFFTEGNLLLPVLYLASFPMLYAAIAIGSSLSGLPMQKMLEPTVIMTFSAILIDGVVMNALPSAYGADTEHVMRGAAWLLWAGGVGLLCAWWLARRSPSQ